MYTNRKRHSCAALTQLYSLQCEFIIYTVRATLHANRTVVDSNIGTDTNIYLSDVGAISGVDVGICLLVHAASLPRRSISTPSERRQNIRSPLETRLPFRNCFLGPRECRCWTARWQVLAGCGNARQ